MRLYYFTKAEYGLAAIQGRRLKISDIKQLNDPFDFNAIVQTKPHVKRIAKKLVNGVAENRGIICFTESWNDPTMWAHYGDKHKGICLGFDISGNRCEAVKYISDRITAKYYGKNNIEELEIKDIVDSFFHKGTCWSYEREHRYLATDYEYCAKSELFFQKFNENIVLKEVIAGCRSNISGQNIQAALGDLFHSNKVEIFKTRPCNKTFTMTKDRTTKRW